MSFQTVMMTIRGREAGEKEGNEDGDKNIALFSCVS